MEHQSFCVGTEYDEMLLAAHRETPERDPFAGGHRVGQQSIGLGATPVALQIIRLLEVNRIHFGQRYKLSNLDRRIATGGLETFQFLVSEDDIAALFDFKAAHQLAAIDYRVVHGAINLLLNATAVLLVQQIEADRLRPCRRE